MKKVRLYLLLLLVLTGTRAFAGTLVQFELFFSGYEYEVDVELYDQDKPVTTRNFINLIKAGAYNNGFFHRLQTGFVLQGGGYSAINPGSTNIIAPPFANLYADGNFGNITNEIARGHFYSNTNGTIAMAKGSDPNSANSQFFFNLADNSASLDNTNNAGGFTVFGHTLRGISTLDAFGTLSYGNGVVDLTQIYGANGIFNQLPTYQAGTNAPPYQDLFYYTVTLPTIQVKTLPTGGRQISWTAVYGVTNELQYTTNLLAPWSVITTTTTNVFNDPSTNNSSRFYRIHYLF